MQAFRYTGRDASGRGTAGTVTAESELDVAKVVEAAGYYVTSIVPAESHVAGRSGKPSLFARGITRRELIVLLRQIETLYRAGVPIATGIDILEQQCDSKVLKEALKGISHEIREGRKLSEAFERRPDLFPPLVTANLVAGEETGALDEVLKRVAEHLDHEDELERFVKGALRYPSMIVVALVGVVALMVFFIFPKMAPLFNMYGDNLPLPTKVIKWTGDNVTSFGPILFATLGLGFVAFASWKRSPRGRLQWERLVLMLPTLGPIFRKLLVVRFARSFAVVFRTGVPVLRAIEIVAATLDHKSLEKELYQAKARLQLGTGIADAIRPVTLMTPLAVQLISIGEQTGRVDDLCMFLATHYEEEARYDLKSLLLLIEPLLSALLAVIVGFVALGLFMPLWNMVDLIKR